MPYSNYVFTSSLLCRLYSVYKLQLIYYAIIRAKRCLYECKQPKVKLNNKNKRIMSQRMVDFVERNKIYYYSFIQNMSLFLTNLNPLYNSSQLQSQTKIVGTLPPNAVFTSVACIAGEIVRARKVLEEELRRRGAENGRRQQAARVSSSSQC